MAYILLEQLENYELWKVNIILIYKYPITVSSRYLKY